MAESSATPRFHRKRCTKCIRAQEGRLHYVLERDIFMDHVSSLCAHALVGRLEYCRLDKAAWVDWASKHWKPLIDYLPTISLLANGWILFVFLEKEHCSHILNRIWHIGKGSLVLGC